MSLRDQIEETIGPFDKKKPTRTQGRRGEDDYTVSKWQRDKTQYDRKIDQMEKALSRYPDDVQQRLLTQDHMLGGQRTNLIKNLIGGVGQTKFQDQILEAYATDPNAHLTVDRDRHFGRTTYELYDANTGTRLSSYDRSQTGHYVAAAMLAVAGGAAAGAFGAGAAGATGGAAGTGSVGAGAGLTGAGVTSGTTGAGAVGAVGAGGAGAASGGAGVTVAGAGGAGIVAPAGAGISGGSILAGIGSAALDLYTANQLEGIGDQAAGMADPFASQRPHYQQLLQDLYSNPQAALEADPGYQVRFDQGLESLRRVQAGTGNRHSGRALTEAQEYGQNFASNEFSKIHERLTGLSGANTGSPGAAGGLFAQGQTGALDARQNALYQLLYGFTGAQSGTTGTNVGDIISNLGN